MVEKTQLEFDLLVAKDALNAALKTAKDNTTAVNTGLTNTEKILGGIGAGGASSITGLINSFGGLKTILTSIAAAFTAGIGIHEAIKAASEEEAAIARMNQALIQSGNYTKKVSQEMQDFGDNISKTTKYTDDQAFSTIALLGTLTKLDADGLKKATMAAADLSSAIGIDLDTATRMIAKGIEGNVTAFNRYGLNVRAATTEAGRFSNILTALAPLSGRASLETYTYSGANAVLNNSFEQLLASFGNIIIKDPLVISAIKGLTTWVLSLKDSLDKTKVSITDGLIKGLEFLITVIPSANTLINTLIATLTAGLLTAVVTCWTTIKAFGISMGITFAEIAASATSSTFIAAMALQGFAVAARVATVAFQAFKVVLSFGLLIALDAIIFKLLEMKDALGSWGNLFTTAANNIKIFGLTAQIIFVELLRSVKTFGNTIIDSVLYPINLLFEKLGKEKISFQPFDDSVETAAKTTAKLTDGIINLVKENKNLELSAKKTGTNLGTNLIGPTLEKLKSIKAEYDAAIENTLKGKKSITVGVGLDKDKIIGDYKQLMNTLAGLEQGETGRLNVEYQKRLLTISQYLSFNKDKSKEAAALRLAVEADYSKKLVEILKKENETRASLVDNAIAAIKDPIKSAFNDIYAGLSNLDRQKFAPQIQIAINTNLAGIALGFVEALKQGSVGFLSTVAGFVSNLTDPEKFKNLFGKLEQVMPEFAQGLKKFADAMPGWVGAIINIVPAILNIFGQAPEAFRKMISDSITEIPKLLGNILINIAELISAKFIDTVIVGFINNLPYFVESLVYAVVTLFSSPAFWLRVVTAAVAAFIKAIPRIVQGFIDGFKTGFADLFKGFGDIFKNLWSIIGALWDLVGGVIGAAASFVWKIIAGAGEFVWTIVGGAGSFVWKIMDGAIGFVAEIILGAARFVNELVSKIPVVGGILGGSNGGGGILGGVTDFVGDIFGGFGFAKGGIVPQGFPNDTFPARLTSGEAILPAGQLESLTNSQKNSEYLLTQILSALKSPQSISSEITINKRAFADIMLDLSRSNARMA